MRTKKQTLITIVVILMCLCCVAGLVNSAKQKTKDIITLHGGWMIAINDGEPVLQKTKDLSDYSFFDIKDGDVIHLERELREDFPFEQARLVLDTWHVALIVSLDDRELYHHGYDYVDSPRMLGNIRHYITLPEGYQGKTLHIEMICTEDGAMSGLTPIGLADVDDMSVEYYNRLYPLLYPATIMLGIGLLIMVAGVLFYSKENNMYKIFYLGALLLLVGVYSLCRAQFVRMVIANPAVYNTIEFMSLYFLPITLIYLFMEDRHKLEKK